MKIKDIAELAGVSISTVSKIVNNKDQNINPETRKRVLQIVKEYNYAPYSTVKNATNAKTFLLGVLVKNSYEVSMILKGAISKAQELGYSILLLESNNDLKTESKQMTVFAKNNVEGILWEPVSTDSFKLLDFLREHNILYALLQDFPNQRGFSINYSDLGYALAQNLIQLKHTNIACFVRENDYLSDQVIDGCEKCLYDHDILCSDEMNFYLAGNNYDEILKKLVNRNVTGIICSRYEDAKSFYHNLTKYHYSVPTDFSLVCLKPLQPAMSSFSISGIKIPYFEFGAYVCQALIKQCEHDISPDTNYLYPIAREIDCFDTIDKPPFYRNKHLVVVGSINSDTTFLVNRLPQNGKTITIHGMLSSPGGKGLNQAVGVAKLGHEVALIGEVGNDIDALNIFDILEKEQIIPQGVHRDKNTQTGKAYIYLKKDGESAITVLPGANNSLNVNRLKKRSHLFKDAAFCLLSTEIPLDTAIEAAKTAHSYNARTILKPAALKTMPYELLDYIDILIINKKEADIFCPECISVKEQADFFFEKGIQTVIITLGSKGCYLKSEDISKAFPAAEFPPIDTTGGADSFISAFAAYLTEGYSLVSAVQIATYAAGFCISRQGVIPSLVDKNTLEAHIAKFDPGLLNKAVR